MINVITCVDTGYYYNKMGHWLEGSKLLKSASVYIVTLDFDVEDSHKVAFPHINYIRINRDQCPGINTNNCFQHGDWLNVFGFLDEKDIVVCIDGDAIIQRDFDSEELEMFNSWKDNVVGMNWNAGYGDTLTAEAYRISPIQSLYRIKEEWYPDKELACHNAGVIIANISTWRLIYKKYMDNMTKIKTFFAAIAYQQWLINWVAQTGPLSVHILSQTVHSHMHFGMYPGIYLDIFGNARSSEKLCWVRHKMSWSPRPPL